MICGDLQLQAGFVCLVAKPEDFFGVWDLWSKIGGTFDLLQQLGWDEGSSIGLAREDADCECGFETAHIHMVS